MQSRSQNALQQDLFVLDCATKLQLRMSPLYFSPVRRKRPADERKLVKSGRECCVTAGFGRPRMQQHHDARIEL